MLNTELCVWLNFAYKFHTYQNQLLFYFVLGGEVERDFHDVYKFFNKHDSKIYIFISGLSAERIKMFQYQFAILMFVKVWMCKKTINIYGTLVVNL